MMNDYNDIFLPFCLSFEFKDTYASNHWKKSLLFNVMEFGTNATKSKPNPNKFHTLEITFQSHQSKKVNNNEDAKPI